MKKTVIFWFIALISHIGFAQSITMEFPAFAGKTYDFVIFQGSKTLTVVQDTIPANGKFTIKVPAQYVPYRGMSRWLITGTAEGGGLDMAIPGYDFSVSCLSATPSNDNINFTGFDAVNELNRLNAKQQNIIAKFQVISKAAKLYDAKHPLYSGLVQEKKVQQQAFNDFQKALKANTNFNARFLPIVNLTHGIAHRLTDDHEQKAQLVNEFISRELSFDDLYVSGHWTGIIQSWVVLQINVINDKNQFAQDFKQISNRIKKPKLYTDFVGKITYYLTQYSKDDYIDMIAHMVLNSGKVTEYMGSMQVYLKRMLGVQAPDLLLPNNTKGAIEGKPITTLLKSKDFAQGNTDQTLLIFYNSGCGPCETLLSQLPRVYDNMKAGGMDIIAISSDEDVLSFKERSKAFPWKRSYCDFQGIQGVNYKNYGVVATPMLFVIDKTGKIIETPSANDCVNKWSY